MDIKIRRVLDTDKAFWFTLDKHLSFSEFDKKVKYGQGYVILQKNLPCGILRYNLFWDDTPFCTLLYIDENHRGEGLGKKLMSYWEKEMQALGYGWVLVSTRSDEDAQNFYRSIGYSDCGSLIAPNQPAELFLSKRLSQPIE